MWQTLRSEGLSPDDAGRYALWLLPGGEAGRQFALVIAHLARRYQAPGFEPHVTLASVAGDQRDAAALGARCAQLAAQTAAVHVQPRGISSGDAFFRHLYTPLAPNHSLTRLRDALLDEAELPISDRPGNETEPFAPHLSLLYRRAAQRDSDGYALYTADLPLAPFTLNRLALVQLAADPADWRNLGSWPLRR